LPQPLDAPWKDASQYNPDFFNTPWKDASQYEPGFFNTRWKDASHCLVDFFNSLQERRITTQTGNIPDALPF
jgi:hypothetical protein